MDTLAGRFDETIALSSTRSTKDDSSVRDSSTTNGFEGCDDNVITAIGDYLGASGRARLVCAGNRQIRSALTSPTAPAPQRWLRDTVKEMQHYPQQLQQFLRGLTAERLLLACGSLPLFPSPVAIRSVKEKLGPLQHNITNEHGFLEFPYRNLASQALIVEHLAEMGYGCLGDLFAYQWRSLVAIKTYGPGFLKFAERHLDLPEAANVFPQVWQALEASLRRSEVVDLRVTARQAFFATTDGSLVYSRQGRLRDLTAFQDFVRSNLDRGLDVFVPQSTVERICPLLRLNSKRLRVFRLNWADLYIRSHEEAERMGLWVAHCPALEELDLVGRQKRCQKSALGPFQYRWRSEALTLVSLRTFRLNLYGTFEKEAQQLEIMTRITRKYLPALTVLDLHLPDRLDFRRGLRCLEDKFAGWPGLAVDVHWYAHETEVEGSAAYWSQGVDTRLAKLEG